MSLKIITLALDAMPFITWHLPIFNSIQNIDWTWFVMEGVAKPVGCTSWCSEIPPRLSQDGTHEYLESISTHSRVRVTSKPSWNGKLEMVNWPCSEIKNGDVVLEIDVDERWTARQLELIVRILTSGGNRNGALFRCRYFLGPDIVITSKEGYGNHSSYEWRRAWLAPDGFRFEKHEPPEVCFPVNWIGQEETAALGLVFCHYAYATEKQVAFKEKYYQYPGAVAGWKRLQQNTKWPTKLSAFFPWVKDETTVDKLK